MKITIEASPFGDAGEVYEGEIGMFKHFRLQLISYRDQPKTKEQREHLEADIAGYDEVIASGKEENARAFLVNKRDENHRDKFKNNLELVQFLKDSGQWK